jgi:hypothetical protein
MQATSNEVFKQETDLRLKVLESKFENLDNDIQNLVLMINELVEQNKDLQTYSIQLASMQDRLSRYISHWPFVRNRE